MLVLSDHLQHGASTPFVWGETDCCLFVSDWVAARCGADPMATWRGRYQTRRGAYRRIRKGGGFLATVSTEFEGIGLQTTDDPQTGDVAVISTQQGEALAIRTPTGWASKGLRGLVVGQFSVLRAWAV